MARKNITAADSHLCYLCCTRQTRGSGQPLGGDYVRYFQKKKKKLWAICSEGTALGGHVTKGTTGA